MKYAGKKNGIKYISNDSPKPQTDKLTAAQVVSRRKERESAKADEQNNMILRIIGMLFIMFQAVVTAILIVTLLNLGILPDKYLVVISVILAVLLGIGIAIQLIFKKKNAVRNIGMVLSALVSIILIIGSVYLSKTNTVIEQIADNDKNYSTYDVVILSADKASDIQETADYTFGTCSNFNKDSYPEVISELNKRLKVTASTQDYVSAFAQVDALYGGEVDAVIYEHSFQDTISEQYTDYESKIKVIDQIKIENSASVTANQVDVLAEPFIVFISGNDQWGEVTMGGRSDVNILVCVNPSTQQILLVTVPRDYYVNFVGLDDPTVMDKLTHAGIYGVDVQINTLENLFDCDINYFMQVNFTSIVDIVDAVGGITVNNQYAFETDYVDGYGFTFPEGEITLTGEEALWYCRERHHLEDGDLGRGRHQQEVIEGILNKVTSASAIMNYDKLLDAVSNCMITNMPKSQMTEFMKYQLEFNPKWHLFKTQALGDVDYMPSYAAGGQYLSVVLPYESSVEYISDLVAKISGSSELMDEEMDFIPEEMLTEASDEG